MASWFLTWFVHEFPDFGDSLNIFDFQLTELGRAKELSPVYIASSVSKNKTNNVLIVYWDL